MPRDSARAVEALCERCHASDVFQRILRRDQPPDLVEPELRQRQAADRAMAFVGRVEGAAQKSDAKARRRQEAAERGGQVSGAGQRSAQGRTWPVPRTRFL